MTLRRLTVILGTLAALLGAGHLSLTLLLYREWTLNALWFAGTGLAMMNGAAANILSLGSAGRMNSLITIVVNLAMTTFFVLAWTVLPEPQVIVGGLLFAALAVCAATKRQAQLP